MVPQTRSSNIPISGIIFKENAINLAEQFGLKNCQVLSGSQNKFKERHMGLHLKACVVKVPL